MVMHSFSQRLKLGLAFVPSWQGNSWSGCLCNRLPEFGKKLRHHRKRIIILSLHRKCFNGKIAAVARRADDADKSFQIKWHIAFCSKRALLHLPVHSIGCYFGHVFVWVLRFEVTGIHDGTAPLRVNQIDELQKMITRLEKVAVILHPNDYAIFLAVRSAL